MESLLRVHVLPLIGAMPAAAVTRRHVQSMVDELAAEQSPETARKAVRALSVAMRVAERDGVIDRNPVEGIAVPQNGAGERPVRALSAAEVSRLIHAAKRDDERLGRSLALPLVSLAVGTGLRLGELLALRWGPWGDEDEGLDLDGATARVRWSLDRHRDPITGIPATVRPKSRAGIRDVPLTSDDTTTMRRHRLATGRPAGGELVFSDRGRPLLAIAGPTHTWRRVVKAADVSPAPRFHDLRHTWCVFMLRAAVPPPAVAKLGGWSDVGIIHRRYGRHALPDELAGAADALAAWRASQMADGHVVVTP
jgi:integrase